jgi:hypothetical protein
MAKQAQSAGIGAVEAGTICRAATQGTERMTGIEGVGWPIAPRIGSRATKAASGFAVPSDSTATEQAAAATATHATSIASMLTLQELGDETVQDREARRHGNDLLAALAELQRALLSGSDGGMALHRLAELAAAVPLATDRRLAAMVSAIVVRARVELARRQV